MVGISTAIAQPGSSADPALLAEHPPSPVEVVRVVRFFSDRDALLREAAVRRLLPHPEQSRAAVLRTLREGSLAARLTALELLRAWQAPVEELDPWQPESFSEQRLAGLAQWLEAPLPQDLFQEAGRSPQAAEQMDELLRELDRLLLVPDEEAAAIQEWLARQGQEQALMPEVQLRLRDAASDQQRERLMGLRYRLVADGTLGLRWPGGLQRLASSDPQTRRRAAEELTDLASLELQPLLLELFSDPDPLVRELSLRGLRNFGGARAASALVSLLDDPEPNVKAAVLKQLAEDALEEAVPAVADYVRQEEDADLLVHAIRYFREVKNTRQILEPLIALLEHESWQVRAEAAQAVGSWMESQRWSSFSSSRSRRDESREDVYQALYQRLEDPDPFVVSRVLEALAWVDTGDAIEPLVAAAEAHPQLAVTIVELLAEGQAMRKPATPHLRGFFTRDDPSLRAAAIRGLVRAQPEDISDLLRTALADESSDVRIAAAEALLVSLDKLRPNNWDDEGTFPTVQGKSRIIHLTGPVIIADTDSSLTSRLQNLAGQLGKLFGSARAASKEPELAEVELSEAELSEAELSEAELSEAELSEAELSEVELSEAELSELMRAARQLAEVESARAGAADFNTEPSVVAEGHDAADMEHEAGEHADVGQLQESRWDVWLAELQEGKHRPAWTAEMLEPLERMLQSELSRERLAAALTLIPLGRRDLALPVLHAPAERQELMARAREALKWLPWPDRLELFQLLAADVPGENGLIGLLQALSAVEDPRNAELIWEMLGRPDAGISLAESADRLLRQAYFGSRYYDVTSLPASRRRAVVSELQQWVRQEPLLRKLVVLKLLLWLDAGAAQAVAGPLAEDPQGDPHLRLGAFQISLLAQSGRQRQAALQAAMEGEDPHRREIAFRLLVMEESGLQTLQHIPYPLSLDVHQEFHFEDFSKPIVPLPPLGLEADQVRPFVNHDDPQTAAMAGYLLALHEEPAGLQSLLAYWESLSQPDRNWDRLVYRALAVIDDPQYLPLLSVIYERLQEYDRPEFYWTIRIMSGTEVLQFRQRLRRELGMDNLR